MSILNDALKRASQTDRDRQRPIPSRVPIEPVGGARGRSLVLAMVAGSALALGLAVWFFWQLLFASHTHEIVNAEPVPVEAPKSALPAAVREAIPPTVVLASAPPVTAPAPTVAPAPAPAPEADPPARPAEAAWPVRLKVTGIFFRKNNPLALINAKTVGIGDEIDGIRVTKIESDRVTVEWNGKVKELVIHDGGN
jgi:hypothetical protein